MRSRGSRTFRARVPRPLQEVSTLVRVLDSLPVLYILTIVRLRKRPVRSYARSHRLVLPHHVAYGIRNAGVNSRYLHMEKTPIR